MSRNRSGTRGPLRHPVVLGFVALSVLWGRPAPGGPPPAPAAPLAWHGDLPSAQRHAQSGNRLLWVQFTGPWCPNCVRMERESFRDPRVVGLAARDFVPVKLRSDEHEALALSHGFSALPATLLLRPSGEVVARVQGYVAPDALAEILAAALNREGRGQTARAATSGPASPRSPKEDPPVALAGYCPVSLVESRRLVPGKPDQTLEHEGRLYRFASPERRAAFLKQAARYAPLNGGHCPVTQVEHGERVGGSASLGILYEGHLYLFASAASRLQFLRNPDRYARVDAAGRGFCPHCWAIDGLLVRGSPRFELTQGGRRYLFPDAGHREAFGAQGATTLR